MARDDWAPLLDDLAARHAVVEAMGGPERLAQLAERRRLDVRTRIGSLVDPGSFVEYGALVGSVSRGALPIAPADAFVMGHGTIEGRPVLVGAADPTVMGGSVGPGTLAKRRRLLALARLVRRPVVLLLDGPGLRTQHPNDAVPGAVDELAALAALATDTPVVAVALGPVAGHDALVAGCANHVVMTRTASIFGAGPPLVHALTGLEVTASELGGAAVHASGLADVVADDEADALARARAHIVAGVAPEPARDVPAASGSVLPAVLPADPDATYDLAAVVAAVADPGTWVPAEGTGGGLVAGTIRLAGIEVLVLASDPSIDDGRIDAAAADDARRVLEGAPATPVLVLVDSPGPTVGPEAERAGGVRSLARLLAASNTHAGPTLAVILRRAHGDVPTILGFARPERRLLSIALPGARLGPLPAETGSEAAGRSADLPALIEHTEFGGAVDAADRLLVDRVVEPAQVRDDLIAALRLVAAVRV
ncbi:MAG: carboxyl transferase domain-containing protein [Actinomycetes bacterium]